MINLNQNTNELISVVIPLYNHENYIEECLDSVLNQQMTNIELLLLDDGSTDRGFDRACCWRDRHRDSFVRVEFERQSNAGITRTFDSLIRRSKGKFILFLASDDVLLPSSITNRLALFSDAEVMAVFGDAIPISSAGKKLKDSAIGQLGRPCSRVAMSDPRTLVWELIFRWNVYGSVLISRRDALIKPCGASVLNVDIFSEDMQLYYILASRRSLRYLDEPVAYYRIHSSNISRTPQMVNTIRKNIYDSRQFIASQVGKVEGFVLKMQAATYNRWLTGYKKAVYLPLVAFAYAGLLLAQILYDTIRKTILGQKNDI